MSQYIYVYLKSGFGDYTLLKSFSRNSDMYKYLENHSSYGDTVRAYTETLNKIIEDISFDIDLYKNNKKSNENRVKFIEACNNPLEDKLEELNSVEDSIGEIDEVINNLTECSVFIKFLLDIIAENEYPEDNPNAPAILFAFETTPTKET